MIKHIFIKILILLKQTRSGWMLILLAFSPIFAVAQDIKSIPILLHAARIFDGNQIKTNTSVLIENGQISRMGTRESFKTTTAVKVIDLGEATILPGLIELHAHLSFQNVPADTVLKHGITTIRDLGGPVHQPYGGNGNLRVLTSGPIITAAHGYPIPILGASDIAIAASTEEEARRTVRNLINQGAVIIKIALEPGGEIGAPWSAHHDHGHQHPAHSDKKQIHSHQALTDHPASNVKQEWPLLSEKIVKAIVSEAHQHNRKVTAHIAEVRGAQIAINAGVDEWAHMPCNQIPRQLLEKAVSQHVKIVTTLDTLSKCTGIEHNTRTWSALGGELLYGAEIAHPDIPRGIDAQELIYMMKMAGMELAAVLRAATSKAGQQLDIPLLGTLQPGAPADIIAVQGDLHHQLKNLEYPDLVISGGKIIVNNFETTQKGMIQ